MGWNGKGEGEGSAERLAAAFVPPGATGVVVLMGGAGCLYGGGGGLGVGAVRRSGGWGMRRSVPLLGYQGAVHRTPYSAAPVRAPGLNALGGRSGVDGIEHAPAAPQRLALGQPPSGPMSAPCRREVIGTCPGIRRRLLLPWRCRCKELGLGLTGHRLAVGMSARAAALKRNAATRYKPLRTAVLAHAADQRCVGVRHAGVAAALASGHEGV